MPQPEQRRMLMTEIPGPQSLKLQEQRDAELAGGLGTTMPVFVERTGAMELLDEALDVLEAAVRDAR